MLSAVTGATQARSNWLYHRDVAGRRHFLLEKLVTEKKISEEKTGGNQYGSKICLCDRRSSLRPWKGNHGGVPWTLKARRNTNVTMQKLTRYINVDPGTMNPIQHGEVFVTDDGTETDSISATTSVSSTRAWIKIPT